MFGFKIKFYTPQNSIVGSKDWIVDPKFQFSGPKINFRDQDSIFDSKNLILDSSIQFLASEIEFWNSSTKFTFGKSKVFEIEIGNKQAERTGSG